MASLRLRAISHRLVEQLLLLRGGAFANKVVCGVSISLFCCFNNLGSKGLMKCESVKAPALSLFPTLLLILLLERP